MADTINLADIASVSIGGQPVEVAGALTYKPNGASYEQLINTNGFDDSQRRTFTLGEINGPFRMNPDLPDSFWSTIRGKDVVVIKNDGTKVIGTAMYTESMPTFNPAEYTVDLELRSKKVVNA